MKTYKKAEIIDESNDDEIMDGCPMSTRIGPGKVRTEDGRILSACVYCEVFQ